MGRITLAPTIQRKFTVEDVRKLQTRREEAQNRVVAERNRSNRDEFSVGDAIRLRDVGKATWSQKGVIVEVVTGQDGVAQSYLVEATDVSRKYRHSTYFRHLL